MLSFLIVCAIAFETIIVLAALESANKVYNDLVGFYVCLTMWFFSALWLVVGAVLRKVQMMNTSNLWIRNFKLEESMW